jgi:glycosyltransferase involved in cell wall biosynthesis
MRVMYLSVSAEMGGAERSLFDIMWSIRQALPSWPLHLVTSAGGPLVTDASGIGVATTVLPLAPALTRLGETGVVPRFGSVLRFLVRILCAAVPAALYVRRLRGEIRAFRPDVLHTNSLKMHVFGSMASTSCRTAVVWHLHDYLGSRPVTALLLRGLAGRCAVIVANSASVAEDARRVLGARVPVVPVLNAVDLKRFSRAGDRLDLDALSGMPPGGGHVVRVGLVGTFGRWKGHTTFLDAIARLPADLPVRAYVVGGALYRTDDSQFTLDELRRYAADIGVGDRVGFTGFVARPEEALRALDIVVHASTAPEPFGLVIAEAMACGRAVIASDAGGAREIFTEGVDALSHAPGSAESLAGRIADLARDADARGRMGLEGRRTAERRFDRTRLAADLLPVYQQAVAGA